MAIRWWIPLFLLFLSALSGCNGQPVLQPSPSPELARLSTPTTTPQPTATFPATTTPTLTQTAASSPSPTQTITTPTFTPTTILTPGPTATLSRTGPIGIISTYSGLWAMNQDGSGATLLTSDPILSFDPSPDGRYIVYKTHPDPYGTAFSQLQGHTLRMLDRQTMEIRTITPLDVPNTPQDTIEKTIKAQTAVQAIGLVSWMPGGAGFAFTSGHAGVSSDVYLYLVNRAEIRRLSSGEGQAFVLSWSPDGSRLYYEAADNFGTGAGMAMNGAWVESFDGQPARQVAGKESNCQYLVSWAGNDTLLMQDWISFGGGLQNLRTVDLGTGSTRVLWRGCYRSQVYNPDNGEILISAVNTGHDNQCGGPQYQRDGLYLALLGKDSAVMVNDETFDWLLPGDSAAPWYGKSSTRGFIAIGRDGSSSQVIVPSFDTEWGVLLDRTRSGWWIFRQPDGTYAAKPVIASPNASGAKQNTSGSTIVQITGNTRYDNFSESPDGHWFFYNWISQATPGSVYVVTPGDWQPRPVDPRIENPWSIVWVK